MTDKPKSISTSPALPAEYIDEIRKIFSLFSDGKNKQQSHVSNLSSILKGLDILLSEKELEEAKKVHDPGNTSYITVQAIIDIASSRLQCTETKEDLVDAMKVFDDDNDGKLTVEQFKNSLTKYGDKISEDDAEELVTDFDPNNTGFIDIEEFSAVIMEKLKL